MPAVTGVAGNRERCRGFVIGYGAATRGIADKITLARTEKIAREVLASPQGWRTGPNLDASGCLGLEDITGLPRELFGMAVEKWRNRVGVRTCTKEDGDNAEEKRGRRKTKKEEGCPRLLKTTRKS